MFSPQNNSIMDESHWWFCPRTKFPNVFFYLIGNFLLLSVLKIFQLLNRTGPGWLSKYNTPGILSQLRTKKKQQFFTSKAAF